MNFCPNCGEKFSGNICDNFNCDDPWTLDNIRSAEEAQESARTKPSIPWQKFTKMNFEDTK